MSTSEVYSALCQTAARFIDCGQTHAKLILEGYAALIKTLQAMLKDKGIQ